MRTLAAWMILCACAFGQTVDRTKGASVPPANIPQTFTAKVVDVLDGDTIRVASAQVSVLTVRLDGIDAPESDQPEGLVAKTALSALARGKQVRVDWKEKDRYGRLLGKVFVGDDQLNERMVADGLAWQYLKYSKDQTLAGLERSAREAKKGLWRNPEAIAPWDWRNGVRKVSGPAPQTQDDPTVYITDTGTKYHKEGCRHLKASSIPIPLSRARSAYEPCKQCHPPK